MMQDDWIEYRRLILAKLEELETTTKELTEETRILNTQLAILETKAGMWGAGAGILVSIAIRIWF